MHVDIAAGKTAGTALPLQFVSIEIMPLAGGDFSVAMQATLLDEDALAFVGEDLATERVGTIEQVLAVIRQNVFALVPRGVAA
jgi:hypothetical protein